MAPRIVKIEDPPVYRPGFNRKEFENESNDTDDDMKEMHKLIANYTTSKQQHSEKQSDRNATLKEKNYFVPNRQIHSLRITMGMRAKKKRLGTLPKVEKKFARRSQQEKTDMKVSLEKIKEMKNKK